MPSQRRSPTGLWVVVLTTMPTIVSTVFFLLSALLSGWSSGSPSDDPFRELSAAAMARLYAVAGLFFVCYFGAAYGPVMLPIAAVQAARLTHKGGWRWGPSRRAWILVSLGVLAAALFWRWLINLDLFI